MTASVTPATSTATTFGPAVACVASRRPRVGAAAAESSCGRPAGTLRGRPTPPRSCGAPARTSGRIRSLCGVGQVGRVCPERHIAISRLLHQLSLQLSAATAAAKPCTSPDWPMFHPTAPRAGAERRLRTPGALARRACCIICTLQSARSTNIAELAGRLHRADIGAARSFAGAAAGIPIPLGARGATSTNWYVSSPNSLVQLRSACTSPSPPTSAWKPPILPSALAVVSTPSPNVGRAAIACRLVSSGCPKGSFRAQCDTEVRRMIRAFLRGPRRQFFPMPTVSTHH